MRERVGGHLLVGQGKDDADDNPLRRDVNHGADDVCVVLVQQEEGDKVVKH